jgi:hypothetical protein
MLPHEERCRHRDGSLLVSLVEVDGRASRSMTDSWVWGESALGLLGEIERDEDDRGEGEDGRENITVMRAWAGEIRSTTV